MRFNSSNNKFLLKFYYVQRLSLSGLCLLFFYVVNAQKSASFKHLEKNFGYDSQFVFDSLGYVWISNNDGLYKYDGYDFFFTAYNKIFDGNHVNPRKIVFEKDGAENMWLATYNGELSQITPTGIYTSFKDSLKINTDSYRISAIHAINDKVFMGSNNGVIYQFDYSNSKFDSITAMPISFEGRGTLQDIATTDDYTIWASTSFGELFYGVRTNTKYNWKRLEGPHTDPVGGAIRITRDNVNKIWIATENKGLFSYSPDSGFFKKYTSSQIKKDETNPLFIQIFYDDSGKIWAGTDGDGLYEIDIKKDRLLVHKNQDLNRASLSSNTIGGISKDSYGNIWLATKGGTIDILPFKNETINYYSGSENGVPTAVLSVLVAQDGTVWIGTDGRGLTKVSTTGNGLQYNDEKSGNEFFKGRYIQGLVEDSNKGIWIATYLNGLYVFDTENDKFSQLTVEDSDGNTLTDVRTIFKDSKKRIWVSTPKGIHVFSERKEQLALFEYGNHGIDGDISESIAETADGTVWIGVNDGGLFKFIEHDLDFGQSKFNQVRCDHITSNAQIGMGATNLLADKQGNLFFKSAFGSLIYLNTSSNICESVSDRKGFGAVNVQSLELDDLDNLWIGGAFGLHKYNLIENEIESFFEADGLQGNFYRSGSFKSADGELFFGGENGLSSFLPNKLVKETNSPKLYINAIELLNKPAKDLIPEQFKNGIESVETLDLKSHQSSFSFQFSAIENVLNTEYYYAYRLKGFDKEWLLQKSNRSATYTNIPSGSYIFEVKAGTKSGLWDIGTKKIEITIAPPWWRSTFAYFMYVLLFLLIGFLVFRWAKLRLKLRQEEWEYQNEKEVYALKMNFFAKMSHEIQTPLSLILGPIDDMLQNADIDNNRLLSQRLNLIKNNALRLSRISKDLTTIRNKELNQLKVQVSERNIIQDLKTIAMSFAEQARFKKIDFIQEYPQDRIMVWYDLDKIEHVFYNLLSNAFKFTPSEGTIKLKVTERIDKQRIRISVVDSGPGIPKEELKKVFTLFYQSDIGKKLKGSGIGLALTKELIELHHGEIKAKSSKQDGSAFRVYLPLTDNLFSEDEKAPLPEAELEENIKHAVLDESVNFLDSKELNWNPEVYSILIVEDNVEMQIFLKDLLERKYKVSIAENGEEGLKAITQNIPDLIISDVMMPVMDGIEFSRALQKNKQTAHIPVVLLTAKNTTRSKFIGLQSGAVDYLNKPFNPSELVLRINSLLQSKANLIAKTKTDFISNVKKGMPLSKDHTFLQDLVANLNNQLENPDFKLEQLSKTMHMSYSVIYRKCHEITGKTLVEFYRGLKMKRAAILIIEQGYNVSEAAFIVGYKDSKYFSKTFKEEFGTPPVSMRNEAKRIGLSALIVKYKLKSG